MKIIGKEHSELKPTGEMPVVDKADGRQVGEEPVPGMRLRCICRGHTGTIDHRIAWSPCGRFFASSSSDKTIRVWDTIDGKCLNVFEAKSAAMLSTESWISNDRLLIGMRKSRNDELFIRELQLDRMNSRTIEQWPSKLPFAAVLPDATKQRWLGLSSATLTAVATIETGRGDSLQSLLFWNAKTGKAQRVEHQGYLWSSEFSPDGTMLATCTVNRDSTIRVWGTESGELLRTFPMPEEAAHVYAVTWSRDGMRLASAASDHRIRIWEWAGDPKILQLEGHTNEVTGVSFSHDGKVLASKSQDGTIRIWRLDEYREIARLRFPIVQGLHGGGLATFHPSMDTLVTLTANDKGDVFDSVILIWDLNVSRLFGAALPCESVRYASAKIVLVGESNVGKSCLAMRLAEDRYPKDHEQGTTHGMRFWPMEAEALHPKAKPPQGQRRDVVLWDFGGQDEYQLVHQMFLHDTTLALLLVDPTRGRVALDEARDWNKRLEKHLGKDRAVKLLIGSKVEDGKRNLIDQNSIDLLCKECGFKAFLDLSAKTGRNTKRLRKLISEALDWDQIAKTSRPELFQHIRDDIEIRRKKKQIVLRLDAFKRAIKRSAAKLYEDAAVDGVSDQLAAQGIIVRTKLTGGDEVLVLQLPVIEHYAGSLIIAARNNPRGVPVLEERLLGSAKTIPLPGITKKERLSPANERMVLESLVELMIQHGICFRHGGLLVFPTLFPAGNGNNEKLPQSVSLYYDFTGAIDNIYASLVSKLMVSEEFGEGRLTAGRVEFGRPAAGYCGIRQIKRTGGLAHVDLYFAEKTPPDRRHLFTRFVEEHLRASGVEIREHQAIKCQCGKVIEEEDVQANISRGEIDVICPRCRRTTQIGEGVNCIRERNPATDDRMVALRKTIDERLVRDIASVKRVVAGDIRMAKSGEPVRILHLSDLHFTAATNPTTRLQQLLQDLRCVDGEYPAIETVEYLVISGDITDRGQDIGFEKAREFVQDLVGELGLSTQRCILVPGNHDVQDREDAYQKLEGVDGKPTLVRHPVNFPKRFEAFTNNFYHPLRQEVYPLAYAEQGISYLFADTGIQFLTLNSAWQIDKNGRKRAAIHPDAVAGVIAQADDERRRAIERGDLRNSQVLLRIGVWHHAVAGPELVQDLGFMTQLRKAGMRLCLHGDVHELRTELFGYRQSGIEVEILGAGSFGSGAEGRPESTPRLYNLLEVFGDSKTKQHKVIRVHTRQQRKENEAWQGYHEWPHHHHLGRYPFFDIDLM